MPGKSDGIRLGIFLLLLCVSYRIPAQDSRIRIKSYQASGVNHEKLKKNRLLLIPADSVTSGIATFRTSRAMSRGDGIAFSVRSDKNFVYLVGIDAKNNYRQYDQSGTLKSEKNAPGASKSFKLDDKGTEHFILIFSATPIDTNFFHDFAGLEMTMNEVFARRVKDQLGSRLLDPALYTVHSGTEGIRITLTDAGSKALENKVLPVVIDARVSANGKDRINKDRKNNDQLIAYSINVL
ncbi:MAG: hypothetical protein P4L51_17055 [Puia sp.]|nr:hypothetical protein [Puia sp.]